jgi:hypothetical protein
MPLAFTNKMAPNKNNIYTTFVSVGFIMYHKSTVVKTVLIMWVNLPLDSCMAVPSLLGA